MDNKRKRKYDDENEEYESVSHHSIRPSYRRPRREIYLHGLYFKTDHYGSVQVDTDGACRKDRMGQKVAAIGVSFGRFHPLNTGRVIPNIYDNNVAEMGAAAEAIKLAKSYHIKKMTIRTDSTYVIESIAKMINNGETFIESAAYKLCPGLIKHIHRQLEFITIEFEWVKGHNGDDGNENADYLAETALVNYGLPPRGYNKILRRHHHQAI